MERHFLRLKSLAVDRHLDAAHMLGCDRKQVNEPPQIAAKADRPKDDSFFPGKAPCK
jgi:hypothetical protein